MDLTISQVITGSVQWEIKNNAKKQRSKGKIRKNRNGIME